MQELPQLRCKGSPVFTIQRYIGDGAVAVDKQAANGFQLFKHTGPILLDFFGQFAQGKEIAHATHLFADPARFVKMAAQPGVGHGMAGRHQP